MSKYQVLNADDWSIAVCNGELLYEGHNLEQAYEAILEHANIEIDTIFVEDIRDKYSDQAEEGYELEDWEVIDFWKDDSVKLDASSA